MKALISVGLALLAGAAIAQTASHKVDGYIKKDGTYVAPAVATNPNATKADNYSAKGNVNPSTGKEGTVDPYKIEPYKAPKK